MLSFLLSALLGLLSLLSALGSAQAGGLYLYEVGSADVGLAAAGYAARAQDAATAFTNQAGMTRLERPSFLAGAQPLYTNIDFSADGNTTVTVNDGDSNGWLPGGHVQCLS
jgi:long-chain fatty acid transport protein